MREPSRANPEKHLVLVGGGHAHIEVLRAFAMDPVPGVRLSLVSPGAATYYSGMLPGFIAGEYSLREITIDLEPLARRAQAKFHRTMALGLNPRAQELTLATQGKLKYDLISFDIGSNSRPLPATDMNDTRILATRPFSVLLERLRAWDKVVHEAQRLLRLAVVGAGAAGFELALALARRYNGKAGLGGKVKVTLYDGAGRLNANKLGILGRCGVRVESGKKISSSPFPELADLAVVATGAASPALFRGHALADSDGYLRVNEFLHVPDFPNVFGAGDCVSLVGARRIDKAGVFAVREAPVLAENLRAALRGKALTRYRPQRRYLRLLNLADKRAVLEYGPLQGTAGVFWNLKDSIDRKFMEKYGVAPLPPMAAPDCGGCGCKLGGDALALALGEGKLDDVALAKLGASELALAIDYFKDPGVNPDELGRIAAVHALGDFLAKGLKPRYALANVVLERAAAGLARNDLELVLNGARAVFAETGTEIIGGQTTLGDTAALGFALVADTTGNAIWKKTGAKAGDALLLTKPLGSGILLAAAMRFAVEGENLERCLREMQESQGKAMEILRGHAVHAATDVTGFGLAGHLSEMLGEALRARLDLAAIPAYPGARELAARGYVSRMDQENRRAFAKYGYGDDPLLYDPQTAGPLLVSLPHAEAERALEDLRKVAPLAAKIGFVL